MDVDGICQASRCDRPESYVRIGAQAVVRFAEQREFTNDGAG